jgi:hypothetical protein
MLDLMYICGIQQALLRNRVKAQKLGLEGTTIFTTYVCTLTDVAFSLCEGLPNFSWYNIPKLEKHTR